MTCLTKKAGSIWLCRRLPPAFLCVFCNCVCLPSPWSIYADSPTEIFPRGCYISIFYIQLSAFHLPTQFVLLLLFDCDIFNYQLSLIYICLECYLMSVAAGLFCRKMDGRFCRKKPDTDVRRAGRIDVAGVFCRTREGRGQSRSLH